MTAMGAIAGVMILAVVLPAMWFGARRQGNAERSRKAHRDTDLALLAQHGISPPPRGKVLVGRVPLMAIGAASVVLVAVTSGSARLIADAATAGLIIVLLVWPSARYHQAERHRAMTQARAVIAQLPPDEREPFLGAFERIWHGEMTPSMRALRQTVS